MNTIYQITTIYQIFDILIRGALDKNKKDEYTERLKNAGKLFSSINKKTNMKHYWNVKKMMKLSKKHILDELVIELTIFLPYVDLFNLIMTNKYYKNLLYGNFVWKRKFETEYPGYKFPKLFDGPTPDNWAKRTTQFFNYVKRTSEIKDIYGNEVIMLEIFKNWSFKMSEAFLIFEKYVVNNRGVELTVAFLIDLHKLFFSKDFKYFDDFLISLRGSIYEKKKFVKGILKNIPKPFIYKPNDRNITRYWESKDVEPYLDKYFGKVIKYIKREHKHLFTDKIFLEELFKINKFVYVYIDENLKKDVDLLKVLLNIDGLMLRHVPMKLRENKEIILMAIKNNGWAFFDAGIYSLYLFLEAMKKTPQIFSELTFKERYEGEFEEYTQNEEIVLLALKYDRENFYDISEELQNDKKFLLKAIKQDGLLLEMLPKKFRKDSDIVEAAIKQNKESYKFAY